MDDTGVYQKTQIAMYLVDFPTFNQFAKNEGLYQNEVPVYESVPFILEFRKDGVLKAKIEMSSIAEYQFLRKYPNTFNPQKAQNKYWIRGKEWATDKAGELIQTMRI